MAIDEEGPSKRLSQLHILVTKRKGRSNADELFSLNLLTPV
jgi:hypothetical protein